MSGFRQFLRDERGTTAVEYAVMLALIIIVCISSVSGLGGENGALWGGTNSELNTYMGTPAAGS